MCWQVDGLQREVVDIRLLAQHDSILDDNSESDTVLKYTQELLDKVAAQQAASQRINKFQRLFKLEETKLQELDDCADDVNLRHSLWASRVSWAELTQRWLGTELEEVDGAELEETVQVGMGPWPGCALAAALCLFFQLRQAWTRCLPWL